MTYNKYGITFRKIRKQSGCTLAEFSSIGIPASTLSDFERGKTIISLDKIDSALQLIGSSLSDFDYYLNHYTPTETNLILQEIKKSILFKDITRLRELQSICKETNQNYIYLTIKFLLQEGSLNEKNMLINYLYETKFFGIKELNIFYIIMDYLAPQDILNIIKNLKERGKGMESSDLHYHPLSLVLLEAIIVLSKYGLKKESYHLLERIQVLNLAQTMFLKNLFHGVEGFWIYCFKNKSEGKEKIQEFLVIQHRAGQPEVARFYQKKFEALLELYN